MNEKKCRYCDMGREEYPSYEQDGRLAYEDGLGAGITLYKHKKYGWVIGAGTEGTELIKVDYCPFCGRKLEG